jgi:methylmalonyl-CoA/ethylmalonyl-CoA epimerase
MTSDVTGDVLTQLKAGWLRGVDHVAVLVPDIDDALAAFTTTFGLTFASDELLAEPAVRLVHLDAGNVDIQLVQPRGPGRLADDLQRGGPGLHHVCFGVPVLADALAELGESAGSVFVGGHGRKACFLTQRPSSTSIELIEFADGQAYGTLAAATRRILGYWNDECLRDLGRMLAHFADDAQVVTPDGRFTGRAAIASLYEQNFAAYPQLSVDVTARYTGRGSHVFEFTALLADPQGRRWQIEGMNVITLEDGLITRLRSYEDQPRGLAG